MPFEVKHKGMVTVVLRQRAYAVRTEELVFVEHIRQNAAQLLLIDHRRKSASLVTSFLEVVSPDHLLKYLRMPLPEQFNQFTDLGVFFQRTRLKYRGGAERQQSHH